MPSLPQDLYTAQQTRELEHIVSEKHSISFSELMAQAGNAALKTLKQHWPTANHILILCGPGNNGGDGYELARQAKHDGYQVTVLQIGDNKGLSLTATKAREKLLATGTDIQSFQTPLPAADIIVDALLGIGLNRSIDGNMRSVVESVNASQTPVLSLDIPSGLHADNGNVMSTAINAAATINFIGLNIGLFTGHGPDHTGHVYFDSLNVPSIVYETKTPTVQRLSLEKNNPILTPRQRTSHKGLFGHLLVIGGDDGMSGAPGIAAEAGARVGSGLVSIATKTTHAIQLDIVRPELMCHGIETPTGLAPLLQAATAITLGPGLGQQNWGESLYHKTIKTNHPMVVDADALNLLSQNPQHNDHWILTPHPGEAARLLNCSNADIQANRLNAVQELQRIYGGIIVLKGAGTLISNGTMPIQLSTLGNPGMSSGGMGDVLAGVIGGLLAQGAPLMEAACTGVILHSMAGDKAAEQDGERGMLAMDLMPHLRHLSNLIY
jgi:NAD(P)H-hydrate epimerase